MARSKDEWTGRIRTTTKLSSRYTDFGEYRVPSEVTWSVLGEDGSPGRGWPDVTARFEMRDGVPTCVEFRVEAKADDRGISTGDLAVFDLARIAELAFLSHAQSRLPRGDSYSVGVPTHHLREADATLRAASRRRWDTPAAELREVARIYLTPEFRRRQRAEVAERLGVSNETASRRIREARRVGLIPPRGATEQDLEAALRAVTEYDAEPTRVSQAIVRRALAARGHEMEP